MTAAPEYRYECRECGEHFTTGRSDKYFCSTPCRKTWNNRAMVRGAAMYHWAMQWRTERGESGKEAMTELCHVIGQFIGEDKDADRKRYAPVKT